jgi:tetratricopeptide (TPR) repeat protein
MLFALCFSGDCMTLLKKSALLVLGLTVSAFADNGCSGLLDAGDYKRAGDCYIGQLKKNKTMVNYYFAGKSLEQQGRYKESLPYLKEAEKRATGQGDLGAIYNQLAIVYGSLGDKKSELAYDMKSLDIDLKIGSQSDIGKSYNNLGLYYSNNGDSNKALEFYTKALDYLEENERASTYGNMAGEYEKTNVEKAEEYYQKAINIDENKGDYLSLCSHKDNYGYFYYDQDKYDEALQLFDEVKDICNKAGDITIEANSLVGLALCNYKKGNIALAKENLKRAIPLAKQSGNPTVLNGIAYVNKLIAGQIKE